MACVLAGVIRCVSFPTNIKFRALSRPRTETKDVTECPSCKERPGTYYKCFTGALAKLLGRYPDVVDASELWVLLAPERPITDERDFEYYYRKRGVTYYRRSKVKVPHILVSINDSRPDHLVFDYSWVEYNTFASFLKVQEDQERFLVYVCSTCANRAYDELGLEPFELWQLFALPCSCCAYHTLTEAGGYEICPVCFWEDDGWLDPDKVSGPNRITLRQARENYASFGACDEDRQEHVRPPRLEEHPRFYRYFG